MKLNADALTYDQIIEGMRAGVPKKVGAPESDAERAAADKALQKILDAGGVKFQCISCGGEIEPKDMAQCECGGFVCPPCRRVEEDGVCDHEVPDFMRQDQGDGE